MGFSRQEYWSGLPFPSPGDLLDPGIEPGSPAFQVAQRLKHLPAMQETQEMQVQTLGQEDPLDEGMATHSSTFAWRIPWIEDPDRLQSIGLQRVEHE